VCECVYVCVCVSLKCDLGTSKGLALGQIRAVAPQEEKFHIAWCFVVWNE
jgi:hypothetical protein